MKKIFVTLIPALLLLASCETFNVGYTDDRHEAGPDQQGSFAPYSAPSYQTYAGDQLSFGDEDPRVTMTFKGYTKSQTNIEDINELNSYIVTDTENIFVTCESPRFVGTQKDGEFYLGVSTSQYEDGYLTLVFNKEIKGIEIVAVPYNYIDTSWNEEKLHVDKETVISVNDSPYINLSSAQNEDQSIKETLCRYKNYAKENKEKVTIRVALGIAFIRKITLYY